MGATFPGERYLMGKALYNTGTPILKRYGHDFVKNKTFLFKITDNIVAMYTFKNKCTYIVIPPPQKKNPTKHNPIVRLANVQRYCHTDLIL